MKKILALFCAMLCWVCTQAHAFIYDMEGIYDKNQVVYFTKSKRWATGGMAPDRIVLTKKTSSGSGSYSMYYNSKGKLQTMLGSNFEYIKDGRLIAVHNADLKFYEVVYSKGKFIERLLSTPEVRELFPGVQIIKVSEFKDGKVKVKKSSKDKKAILILNDTPITYYKYTFTGSGIETCDIAGLVEVSKFGKIKFSHYGENSKAYPSWIINVVR